jgi:predicted porin
MDAEIYFAGKTTLANGISVAVRVELEGNTSSDTIDESFVALEGAFGRLEMGSTDNAASKTLITAPAPAPGTMTDIGSVNNAWMTGTVAGAGTQQVVAGTTAAMSMYDDDSEKISYYTPRFEGFQLGLSYAAEQSQDRAGGAFNHTNSAATYTRGMALGLNFTRAFGAMDVAASLGGSRWKKPDSANGVSTATLKDPKNIGGGLQVGFAGFRVGGSYVQVKDYQLISAMTTTAGSAATAQAAALDYWSHGRAWDVGATYTFGPAVVGVKYFNTKNRGQTAVLGDDKQSTMGLTGKYTLGPGVDVAAMLYHARSKGAGTTLVSGADVDNNRSTGLVGGLLLSF